MVATPNAGTALADSARIGQLLNRLTNMLQFIPTNGVTDTLDVILAVVQQVAIGAFKLTFRICRGPFGPPLVAGQCFADWGGSGGAV
jgi:hypothetical protein